MEYKITEMTEMERMYTYTQSQQIRMQTGNIGYLRADMDTNGRQFYSSWNNFRDDLRTDSFKAEFNDVLYTLRNDPDCGEMLANRQMLARYCYEHPGAGDKELQNFFFRADSEKYSYMLRLNPNKGEYNLYCYCYRKDWLDHHLKSAERGIRFVDEDYREKFRLKDGGKINISFSNGTSEERTCRFIDDYHLELGATSTNLYHIHEFEELMEKIGARAEPAGKEFLIEPQKRMFVRENLSI